MIKVGSDKNNIKSHCKAKYRAKAHAAIPPLLSRHPLGGSWVSPKLQKGGLALTNGRKEHCGLRVAGTALDGKSKGR